MKKALLILLAAVLCLAAGSCAGTNGPAPTQDPAKEREAKALFEAVDGCRAELGFIDTYSEGAVRRQAGIYAGRQRVLFGGEGETSNELIFEDGGNGPVTLNGEILPCGKEIFAATTIRLGEDAYALIIDCSAGGWVYSIVNGAAEFRCILSGLVAGYHEGRLLLKAPVGQYNYTELYDTEPDHPALFRRIARCETEASELHTEDSFRLMNAVRAYSRGGEAELPHGSILQLATELIDGDGNISASHYIDFFTGKEFCITDPAAELIVYRTEDRSEEELSALLYAHYDMRLPELTEESGLVAAAPIAFIPDGMELDVDSDGEKEHIRFETRNRGREGRLFVNGKMIACPTKIDSIGLIDIDPTDGRTEFFIAGGEKSEDVCIYRYDGELRLLREFYGTVLGMRDGMLVSSRCAWLGGPGTVMLTVCNPGAAPGWEFGPTFTFDVAEDPYESFGEASVIRGFRALTREGGADIQTGCTGKYVYNVGSPLPDCGVLYCIELDGNEYFVLTDQDGRVLGEEQFYTHFKSRALGRD
ncbi:MAG: hypothetical protein IK064_00765 [Clostridia bacterium]|nr:hypothetical protein [Clostridia bacterium]